MSPHWPRHLLAALSFAAVVLLVFADLENAAPGPLSATHAQVEELVGSQGCASCHGADEASLRLACVACHEPIGEQLADSHGLHGTIEDGSDCGRCHLEHASEEAPLVTPEAFAFAGIPTRDEYEHTHLEFGLEGAHDSLGCDACHENADVALLAVGDVRFLGLEQDCAACHESPHERELSQGCADCHSQEGPFDVLEDYEHTSIFPLIEAHDGIGCYDCHEVGSAHSVQQARLAKSATPRDCAVCHEQDHTRPFLNEVAELIGTEPDSTCITCHSPLAGGFTLEGSRMTGAQHAATGFPLTVPHAEAACIDCHEPGLAFEERYSDRSANDCAACHDDPHAGQFELPARNARACAECHAGETFTEHLFDLESHAATAFPLDGAHVDLKCAQCHESEDATLVREFRGTASDCASCHTDVHDGVFEPPSGPESTTDCARCHSTAAFGEVAEERFDHERDARFELRGAHLTAECAICHFSAEKEAHSRAFGLVAQTFPGPKERCDTCHEDVHDGRFLTELKTGQRTDCSTCHGEDSFASDEPGGFLHGAWTGFELRGAHEAAECAACHRPSEDPGELHRVLGRIEDTFQGSPQRCDTCHIDVHDGLLSRDPETGARTDCSRCHNEEAFASHLAEGFHHELWTSFLLDGAHEQASCTACHPTTQPDADGRSFGRALGSSCADCHRDPHLGQFRQENRNDCARCHSSTLEFAVLRFDHNRDSEFALDETHASLACNACHQTWRAGNQATAVRYKPLGRECAACHLPGTGRDR